MNKSYEGGLASALPGAATGGPSMQTNLANATASNQGTVPLGAGLRDGAKKNTRPFDQKGGLEWDIEQERGKVE